MYTDIKRLTAANAQVGASIGVVYTAPAGKRSQIGTVILHNTTSAAKTVALNDNGITLAHEIFSISLTPFETYEFAPKVPLVLEGGQTLQAIASVTATVNIKLYGREEQ